MVLFWKQKWSIDDYKKHFIRIARKLLMHKAITQLQAISTQKPCFLWWSSTVLICNMLCSLETFRITFSLRKKNILLTNRLKLNSDYFLPCDAKHQIALHIDAQTFESFLKIFKLFSKCFIMSNLANSFKAFPIWF